jgi:hypothetical protein
VLYKPDPDPRLDHLPQQDVIRAELRIRAELAGSNTCSARGITVVAYAPVLEMCRRLVAAGHHNPASRLYAYRGDVLCLAVRSIGEAARLEINSKGTGLVRRRAVRTAPPVAPIGPVASPPPESSAAVPAGPGPARDDDDLSIPDFLRRTPISRPRDPPPEGGPASCTTPDAVHSIAKE